MKRKKKAKFNPQKMRCPYCGAPVHLRSSEGIYKTNLHEPQLLWVCNNYPECDAYVRCQEGTEIPLGELADKELRGLRRNAHYYFDKIWKEGNMSKSDAYKWLSDLLCKPMKDVHIGSLNDYWCRVVIKKSKEMCFLRSTIKK